MGIDGVRGVNYVTITQLSDWNSSEDVPTSNLPEATFTYSLTAAGDLIFDDVGDAEVATPESAAPNGGTLGYGWSYNFENAFENGIILPPSPSNPAVFELKKPNQNIRGVVDNASFYFSNTRYLDIKWFRYHNW